MYYYGNTVNSARNNPMGSYKKYESGCQNKGTNNYQRIVDKPFFAE
jgi:hypothetical protein